MGQRLILMGILIFNFSIYLLGSQWSLEVRKSQLNRKNKMNPAEFFLYKQKGDQLRFLLDCGITLRYRLKNTNWNLALTTEYHRNNMGSNEQNNFISYFSANSTLTLLKKKTQEYSKTILAIFPNFSVYYSNDQLADSSKVIVEFKTPIFFAPLKIGDLYGSENFQYYFLPTVGFNYTNNLRGEKGTGIGHHGQFLGNFDLSLYPFRNSLLQKKHHPLLEILFSYTLWQDIFQSQILSKKNNFYDLFQFSCTYFFFQSENTNRMFGIGIDYINGEDPIRGLINQEYIKLSFRFSL